MSIEAIHWALRVPIGGNQKVVLLGLANHAHPDGGEAYPTLDTLASYAACDRSTARRNVRKLAADGWISEDGVGPRGQTKWRLAMGGSETPPGASGPLEDGTSAPRGVARVPPEPSSEPTANRPRQEARVPARRDEAPEGFPDELRPHARAAYVVLRDIAQRRGAKAINARALATTIMARPRKPIVRAAHDLSAWLDDHPATACRDVLARYRRWLDREEDLAGVERLPGEGPAAMPGNVTPIRRGSAEDARQARQAQRLEVARREGLIE